MRYYKDTSGEVFGYDEAQVDAGLPVGKIAMTPEEVEAHINPPKSEEQLRGEWKALREDLVANIKVTTKAGNTFDGDEVSQGRMARAILALNAAAPGTTVNWILADNSVINATAAELIEALAMAGAAQAAVWVPE